MLVGKTAWKWNQAVESITISEEGFADFQALLGLGFCMNA